MLKDKFKIVLLLILFCTPVLGVDIPFTIEKGFLLINAKTDKGLPIEAAIQTGSVSSFTSYDFLRKAKITSKYTNDGPVNGNSSDRILFFADVPNIILGEEKPVTLKMRVKAFEQIQQPLGRKIDMILGADFFKGKILQIDFKSKLLRILDRSPSTNVSLIMDAEFTTFDGRMITLPIVEKIKINGTAVRCLFNTGVPFPLSISPDAAKQYSLAPIPEKNTLSKVQIASLKLDSFELNDVPAVVYGKDAGF